MSDFEDLQNMNRNLKSQVGELQEKVDELQETLRAITSGEVDALMIYGEEGEQIFTLESPDTPYRLMVENVNEGVASLSRDNTILYCNHRLAEMLGLPLEKLLGSSFLDYLPKNGKLFFISSLEQRLPTRFEVSLLTQAGITLPVLVSISKEDHRSKVELCLVISDLTEQKRNEQILASQRLSHAILDQAAEAIVVCDPRGVIIQASQSAVQLSAASPLFRPFTEAFPLASVKKVSGERDFSIEGVLAGNSYQGYEANLNRGNGQPASQHNDLHLQIAASPLIDDRGIILGCTVVMADITERVKAEQALIEQQQRTRDILESITDGFFELDAEWRFTYLNHRAAENFRYESEGLIGKNIWEIFPAIGETEQAALYRQVMSNRQPIFAEIFGPATGRWYEYRIFPSPAGITVYWSDITRRKQIEETLRLQKEELSTAYEELETTNEELARSNQALLDFTSIAAHDLQEPLRKVQAFGHLLETRFKDELNSEGEDYLARLTSAASRMNIMLQDLLNYSRVTTKAEPFVAVDLNQVISDVLSVLEMRIAETQGLVKVDTLPSIQADPTQMRQLFQNLISNALKYRREDEAPLIKITCQSLPDEQIQLLISDNGIGIDMKYARSIFDPFVRLEGRSSKVDGTGMGLAICNKIVERHDGSISVTSQPGSGSTFRVILPKKH